MAAPIDPPINRAAGQIDPEVTRAPFWLTDQQLSVEDRNRALARFRRSSRSLMGM